MLFALVVPLSFRFAEHRVQRCERPTRSAADVTPTSVSSRHQRERRLC